LSESRLDASEMAVEEADVDTSGSFDDDNSDENGQSSLVPNRFGAETSFRLHESCCTWMF
jgi:hypothetical protein